MNKKLKKVLGEDDQQRGEPRYTRLLLEDDKIVAERGGTPSAVISDLVHKGLAYEALQRGADDPVIRGLLRTFDQLIRHRLDPLAESLRQSQAEVARLQLFVAALFMTLAAKLDFPLENADEQTLDDLHDGCAGPANQMLALVMPQAATAGATPLPDRPSAPPAPPPPEARHGY